MHVDTTQEKMRRANRPSISSKGNYNTSSSQQTFHCEKHMELNEDLLDEECLSMEGPRQVNVFLPNHVKVVKELLEEAEIFE